MRFLFALFFLFSGLGHGADLHQGRVELTSDFAVEDVERAVRKSLLRRQWRLKEIDGQTITARLFNDNAWVDIKVTYQENLITIAYIDSAGLKYKEKARGPVIKGKYNRWIRNLEYDIPRYLARQLNKPLPVEEVDEEEEEDEDWR